MSAGRPLGGERDKQADGREEGVDGVDPARLGELLARRRRVAVDFVPDPGRYEVDGELGDERGV